jgi:hypothetical protein
MNCPNCSQLIEDSAAFCGNCGQAIDVHAPEGKVTGSHIAEVLAHQPDSGTRGMHPEMAIAGYVPSYAIAAPVQHVGETKAVLSLLLGIVGILGALFVALVGLSLGVAGLALGTMSRNTAHRRISTLGIIFSTIAIIASLGVWAYAIHRQSDLANKTPVKTVNAVAAADLVTPCYAAGFIDTLNVTHAKNSCDMNAFNGRSLEASTKAYKVYSSQIAGMNPNIFNDFAKKAIEKDIAVNLSNFNIESELITQFAGSPAYIVKTVDKSTGVAVTEAMVLHQVQAGANIFVLVQASSKGSADMSTLEAQWQWR